MATQIKKKFLAPEVISYFDDQIAEKVSKSGDTMSGALILNNGTGPATITVNPDNGQVKVEETGVGAGLINSFSVNAYGISIQNEDTQSSAAFSVGNVLVSDGESGNTSSMTPFGLSITHEVSGKGLVYELGPEINSFKFTTDGTTPQMPTGDAELVVKKYVDDAIEAIPAVDLVPIENRLTALENYHQETVFVDSVNGVDEVGRGSMLRPFKTINYAYSQVLSYGNPTNTVYNDNVGRFITEKLVIKLAPGTYTENVVLGFKRARVAIVGNGATIVGDVKMEAKLADFPADSLRGATIASQFPAPWTGWTSGVQQCFEIAGDAGGALEADATSNTVQVTGLTSLVFAEPSVAGSGVGSTWDSKFGSFYIYVKSASLGRGVVAATQHSSATPSMTEVVCEIDSARIGSEQTVRNYFGGVPFGYIANYSTWSLANNGATNKAPTGAVTVKMHNTTMASTLGPRLTVGEIDGCRLYDIDRTMGGTVDNGGVSGSTSSSYAGFVNCQFRAYSGTNALKLGNVTGATRWKMDSVSYTTLSFSRNSSGVLTARTLDLGAGVSFDFLDDARSIFVNDPATNYTRALNTVDSALEGIDAALGTKVGSSDLANYALKTYVDTAVAGVVNSAPETLNTLNELANALGSDPNFATTVATQIGGLDLRIDALEAAPSGHTFVKESYIAAEPLTSQTLGDLAVANSLNVFVGRLALHEGTDYTVSVVAGKTVLTWAGDFAVGGVEAIEAGDKIFVTYAIAG